MVTGIIAEDSAMMNRSDCFDCLARWPRLSAFGESTMQSSQPSPLQIDLIRNLVRSVTPENSHAEYEKARLQFGSKEQFQAALRLVELEVQQHLALIEHWHHLAKS
jgi:hypothetical protein